MNDKKQEKNEESKYFRDKFVMEQPGEPNLLKLRNKQVALTIGGVSEDNYHKIMESHHGGAYEKNLKEKIMNYQTKTELASEILKIQPIYYDKYRIWWKWDFNSLKWEIVDETDILNLVRDNSISNTVSTKEKTEILESLKQESRLNKPREMKNTWIQFKDTVVDVLTGDQFFANPKYFVTNPIPYYLNEERFEDTPIMDRIFEEWVGKEHVQKLYQILAYCLLPSYPIHRIFCFIGSGMNGKSKFLELLRKFIGKDNCCSTELDTLLNSRFEVTRLHKKLVCQMGETNFNEMSKTSILKKLSGGDLIGFEYKRKDPFEENNYAKIIIATNNLPTTTDKTIGFYRRWMLIDFPNQFSERKDILKEIPEEEYSNLAVKCLRLLKDLLEERCFDKEGSIEDRMKRYEDKSNPLNKFWEDCITEDYDSFIFKYEFTKKLNEYCKDNNLRQISETLTNRFMKDKGIIEGRKYPEWYTKEGDKKPFLRTWEGVKLI
jgi:P4 family phage/plasmid primase-like protien